MFFVHATGLASLPITMKKSPRRLAKLVFPKAPAALHAQDLANVRGGSGTGLIIPCIKTLDPCWRLIVPCVRLP